MDYVNLYTRQHENSIFELQSKGEIVNKEIYVRLHMGDISEFFMDRYDTFVRLAEKIVPRPPGSDYPIWTSVSKDYCLKPIEKELVYCLRVPKDQVIYFDGHKWDYVLNNLYIPLNKEDNKDFREELKKLGIENEFSILNGKYKGQFPKLEKRIRDSWERIFIIEEWNEIIVQGNLWKIKLDWIERILRPGDDIFEEPKEKFDFQKDLEIATSHQKRIFKDFNSNYSV